MANARTSEDASNSPSKVVLVVDSDEHARFIYRTILQHAGFEVITATDALIGLHVCQHTTPTAVVLDVDPPTCPSFDAAQALANDARHRRVMVVALTRRAMLHELRDIRGPGFKTILVKPVDPKLVVDAVRGEFGVIG